MYKDINQNQNLRNTRMISFTSGKLDMLVNEQITYLKIKKMMNESLDNLIHFDLLNIRNVYVPLDHIRILTYPPFINIQSH